MLPKNDFETPPIPTSHETYSVDVVAAQLSSDHQKLTKQAGA